LVLPLSSFFLAGAGTRKATHLAGNLLPVQGRMMAGKIITI
jgi:hypothetical protein